MVMMKWMWKGRINKTQMILINVNDDTGLAIFLKDLANNKKVPTSQNTTAMEDDAHVSSPDQDAQHHVADKAAVTNDHVVKKTMSFFVTCCL
jgi:hypothetical protein